MKHLHDLFMVHGVSQSNRSSTVMPNRKGVSAFNMMTKPASKPLPNISELWMILRSVVSAFFRLSYFLFFF